MNNTNTKLWIRVAVLAAILAWPALESYRYYAATRELAASEVRLNAVNTRLAAMQAKQSQMARSVEAPAAPEKR